MTVRAIVTDIEGTTSSISFVHDVLFPYASRELPGFVQQNYNDPEVADLLDAACEEAGEPGAELDRIIEILLEWIAEDRKATPLKALQGLVWRHGYANGDFTGHMYDDAVDGLRAWSQAGIALYVYSSGSVGAQKLLFGHSDAGDLQPLFAGYFDTNVGHKREQQSYERIATSIGVVPGDILFLSDIAEELDAARDAGMKTCQLVRDSDVVVGEHAQARDFAGVLLD